jgi:phosphoenolpyruvate phosphomutase
MLRAALQAMRRTAAVLRGSNTAREVEDQIAPLRAVFALQREDAKAQAEDRYLAGPGLRCVILAASRGCELGELTRELPKCMVPVGGRPLLDKLLAQLRGEGVRDLVLVRGYGRERVAPEGVTLRDNEAWESTGELASLAAARDLLTGDTLVSYGDVLFKRYILHELLASTAELAVVVDGSRSFAGTARPADRVRVSAPAPRFYEEAEFRLMEVRADLPDDQADGEWIGLLYASGAGAALLREGLDEIMASPAGRTAGMETLLNWLAARAPVRVLYVHGDWIDIDRLADLGRALLVQDLHAV